MPVEVLIMQESPIQALHLKLILQQQGFDVFQARSGRAGLRIALHRTPDAIILDVNLPDVDGFRVCRTLKTHPTTAQIPLIMLTGQDPDGGPLAGLNVGADAYISKDDAENNLLQALRDLGILMTEGEDDPGRAKIRAAQP